MSKIRAIAGLTYSKMRCAKATVGTLLVLSLAACAETPPAPDETLPTRGAFTDRDFECLREAIYHEAAAGSIEGGRAVAHVIINRAEDPRFPNSICGVVSDGESRGRCQFSYRCDGRPETFSDQVKLAGATKAAEYVVANPEDDPTAGATFFHAKWMAPGWFARLKRTVVLGGNIFYQG